MKRAVLLIAALLAGACSPDGGRDPVTAVMMHRWITPIAKRYEVCEIRHEEAKCKASTASMFEATLTAQGGYVADLLSALGECSILVAKRTSIICTADFARSNNLGIRLGGISSLGPADLVVSVPGEYPKADLVLMRPSTEKCDDLFMHHEVLRGTGAHAQFNSRAYFHSAGLCPDTWRTSMPMGSG
jgi:hypothetical protein